MRLTSLTALLMLVISLFSTAAYAAPVKFNLAASITQIGVTSAGSTNIYPAYDFHGMQFSLGDALYGQLTYGPGSTDSDLNGIDDSILIYTGALQSISLSVPSAQLSVGGPAFDSGLILVTNNSHQTDLLWFQQAGPNGTSVRVYYEDETGAALDDFFLPIPFDAPQFTYGFAEFSIADLTSGDRLFISASIEETEFQTALPEPSASILFGIGLLAVFWRCSEKVRLRRHFLILMHKNISK